MYDQKRVNLKPITAAEALRRLKHMQSRFSQTTHKKQPFSPSSFTIALEDSIGDFSVRNCEEHPFQVVEICSESEDDPSEEL
jgi:hypothetical protein